MNEELLEVISQPKILCRDIKKAEKQTEVELITNLLLAIPLDKVKEIKVFIQTYLN